MPIEGRCDGTSMRSIELADRAGGGGGGTSAPSTSAPARVGIGDVERGKQRRDDDEDDVEDDEDASSSIDALNDDGYFGNADGAWLTSDRAPLVRANLEDVRARWDAGTSFREDVEELFAQWGWFIAASAFCVGLLVVVVWFFVVEVEPGHPGVVRRRRG